MNKKEKNNSNGYAVAALASTPLLGLAAANAYAHREPYQSMAANRKIWLDNGANYINKSNELTANYINAAHSFTNKTWLGGKIKDTAHAIANGQDGGILKILFGGGEKSNSISAAKHWKYFSAAPEEVFKSWGFEAAHHIKKNDPAKYQTFLKDLDAAAPDVAALGKGEDFLKNLAASESQNVKTLTRHLTESKVDQIVDHWPNKLNLLIKAPVVGTAALTGGLGLAALAKHITDNKN